MVEKIICFRNIVEHRTDVFFLFFDFNLAWRFAMLEPYGFIILLMLMFTGVLGVVLSPFVGLVTQVLTVVFNLR